MNNESLINELKVRLEQLEAEYFRNNFTAHQDFNKSSNFTTKLKVPVYATKPTTCEIGEIVSNGGKLWHCSATDTWTAQT